MEELEELEAQEEGEATTRPEASPLSNPTEFQTKEGTAGEGGQDGGMTKTRQGFIEVITRGSRPQSSEGGIVPQEKEAPPKLEAKCLQAQPGRGREGQSLRPRYGWGQDQEEPGEDLHAGKPEDPATAGHLWGNYIQGLLRGEA